MKLKYLILSFLFLFSVFVVSAQDLSFNLEYAKDSDVKIQCTLNNSYCPTGTQCKLTVFYPNSTPIISNQEMTFNPSYFNYTLTSSQLSVVGVYRLSTSCNYTTTYINTEGIYFGVVKRQPVPEDTNFVSETKILVVLILITLVFFGLWLLFYFKDKPLHYLFIGLGFISLDALIWFIYLVADNYSSYYSGVLYKFFWIMLMITFLVTVVIALDIFLIITNWVQNVQKNKKEKMWSDYPLSDRFR